MSQWPLVRHLGVAQQSINWGPPPPPVVFLAPLWVVRWGLSHNLTVLAPYINLVLAGDVTYQAFKISFN